MCLNTYTSLNGHVNTCSEYLKSRIWGVAVFSWGLVVDVLLTVIDMLLTCSARSDLQHTPNVLLIAIETT
jgi:hypothetical protein